MDDLNISDEKVKHANRELSPTETLEKIMNEFGTDIKRLVYSYVKDPSDADDVTQEVFVTVYKKLHTFRGQSTLRSWVYRIAINKSKDYLRSWKVRNMKLKEKLENYTKVLEKPDTPEDYLIEKNESTDLLNLVFSLPIKYREVIILFYFKDLSIQEIADSLAINGSTVRTRLNRGRKKLKELIQFESGGDLG